MTAVVAACCRNGVVVGADSAATFGGAGQPPTMRQSTGRKIEIIDNSVIVAGSGYTGHMLRFSNVVATMWRSGKLRNLAAIEVGKRISKGCIDDATATMADPRQQCGLVAFPRKRDAHLCEFELGTGLQPDLKSPNDLWHCSLGIGQPITDPFLAFLRNMFWVSGAPNVRGGILTVLWTLMHACDVVPAGVHEPIHIAVLERNGGGLVARMLSDAELNEHRNIVESATDHIKGFRDVLLGQAGLVKPPDAPSFESQDPVLT